MSNFQIIGEIKDIMTIVINTIESDEDIQYDDVADYIEEASGLIDLHFPHTLSKYMQKIMDEAYVNKGCMESTTEYIRVLIDSLT